MQTQTPTVEDYIAQLIGQPFEWGVLDCYTLIFNWLKLRYPTNRLPDFRGWYSNVKEARSVAMAHKWGKSLPAAFDIRVVPYGESRPGDLMFVNEGGFECGHLVGLEHVYSVYPGQGVLKIPKTLYRLGQPSIIKIEGVI